MISRKLILLLILLCFIYSCGEGTQLLYGSGSCVGYTASDYSYYVLPYEVGDIFMVTQGNCGDFSHSGSSRYAYDFRMPVNTNITASRSGIVMGLKVDAEDGNAGTDANYILIRHNDDTIAVYAHLTNNGTAVALGDTVTQGDVIAYSGNTGYSTGPHLHFEVVDYFSQESVPVTFRNADNNDYGLREGIEYEAKEFEANNNSIYVTETEDETKFIKVIEARLNNNF